MSERDLSHEARQLLALVARLRGYGLGKPIQILRGSRRVEEGFSHFSSIFFSFFSHFFSSLIFWYALAAWRAIPVLPQLGRATQILQDMVTQTCVTPW